MLFSLFELLYAHLGYHSLFSYSFSCCSLLYVFCPISQTFSIFRISLTYYNLYLYMHYIRYPMSVANIFSSYLYLSNSYRHLFSADSCKYPTFSGCQRYQDVNNSNQHIIKKSNSNLLAPKKSYHAIIDCIT